MWLSSRHLLEITTERRAAQILGVVQVFSLGPRNPVLPALAAAPGAVNRSMGG